ncbi:NAD kinase [Callorhinchus milii]|uniref:NAD kinase n=1 Tax=Callorhinchus milii TaxID=7868 RepID=UPI001C3F9CCB|nr:NAD kinase [Callorhinchus milii]
MKTTEPLLGLSPSDGEDPTGGPERRGRAAAAVTGGSQLGGGGRETKAHARGETRLTGRGTAGEEDAGPEVCEQQHSEACQTERFGRSFRRRESLSPRKGSASRKRDSASPKKREPSEKSPRKCKGHRKAGHRHAHFLHGPSPDTHFGPKASILHTSTSIMHIQDPTSQRLTWDKPPTNVLVIKKVRDETLLEPFKELCRFLIEEKDLVVFVEKKVVEDALLAKDKTFEVIRQKLSPFKEGYDDLSGYIDLIICLGGDGTLLYASSLFQTSVPPVMAFHLGSLGFLTPFKFESYRTEVTNVIEGDAAIILRSRLKVKVVKDIKLAESEKLYQVENGLIPKKHIDSESGKTILQVHVLNEVVVDRGPSSYLSNVDLYLNGRHITSVQGDGVIVSTPTGSTAYAAAAGASMMHPNVPAIMITPICPHSLSFRPIVVPAGMELKIMLSPDARNTAWVSFDGRSRQEIKHSDSITVTTSCYPVPSICCYDLVYDWFEGLAECLHWNVRKKQSRLEEITDSSDTEC